MSTDYFCPQCGKEVECTDRFCMWCGDDMGSFLIFCPCGWCVRSDVEIKINYCPVCGGARAEFLATAPQRLD
jgi:hypothetical protein